MNRGVPFIFEEQDTNPSEGILDRFRGNARLLERLQKECCKASRRCNQLGEVRTISVNRTDSTKSMMV